VRTLVGLLFVAVALGISAPPGHAYFASPDYRPAEPPAPAIHWRSSQALGSPTEGRLVRGVQLPSDGRHFFTWDPLRHRSPSRGWRRFGTDGLLRLTLRVIDVYAARHPNAPRIGVGDLSRPHGGDFGPRFGGPGHASHQNGLDVDVYYPRRDRLERPPKTPAQVDLRLAQDLLDLFVSAGAERIFVGPNLDLVGPTAVVRVRIHHDNHLHVRIPRARA
jgi:murein endopeptidase